MKGRIIGKKGEIITVENLVELKKVDPSETVSTGETTTKHTSHQCLLDWTLVFKMASTRDKGDEAYFNSLIEWATVVFGRSPFNGKKPKFSASNIVYPTLQEKEFCACFAAYDMFSSKFEEHPYSSRQIGTLVSFRRDCGIIAPRPHLLRENSFDLRSHPFHWSHAHRSGHYVEQGDNTKCRAWTCRGHEFQTQLCHCTPQAKLKANEKTKRKAVWQQEEASGKSRELCI